MSRHVQVTFDARDPRALSTFWRDVLGYVHPGPPGVDLSDGADPLAAWDEFLAGVGVPPHRDDRSRGQRVLPGLTGVPPFRPGNTWSWTTITVMVPDIHLDPERLHEHGRRITRVSDGLVPLPELGDDARAALASTEPGSAVLAEIDRALAEIDRAAQELAGLTAALHGAATAATGADVGSGDAFRRIAADLR